MMKILALLNNANVKHRNIKAENLILSSNKENLIIINFDKA